MTWKCQCGEENEASRKQLDPESIQHWDAMRKDRDALRAALEMGLRLLDTGFGPGEDAPWPDELMMPGWAEWRAAARAALGAS